MSSLALQQLPLKQSHLIFNRYLTLNVSKTELLITINNIPIPPNILPLSFSISVNGTTSHLVAHTKDLKVILYSLFFYSCISKSYWLCLCCDPFLPIRKTATTLTSLPPPLPLTVIKYQLVQSLLKMVYKHLLKLCIILYDLAFQLLYTNIADMHTYIHQTTWTRRSLFLIVPNWKLSKCPSIVEWTN